LGFDTAVKIHNAAGLGLVALAFMMFFYYFTTGEWKQYKPNKDNILVQIKYYTSGILKGEPHPYHKTELSRLNPLQRITYLNFKVLFLPFMGVTGTMYLYKEYFSHLNLPVFVLKNVAVFHTAGAFVLVSFIIVHVYMTTTGHTIFSNIKAMITGSEEVMVETETAVGD
jgi:thiosulfate reductase cytochrome b subunit